MTLIELLLIGICVLLALIGLGIRFAVRELRAIERHLADQKTARPS